MNSEYEDFDDELIDDSVEFEDELPDFDEGAGELKVEIRQIEFEPTNMRTAILSKDDMVALICLKTADEGGAICRVDPREHHPAVQLYADPAVAVNWYKKSLNSSANNGWTVVYDGMPLKG